MLDTPREDEFDEIVSLTARMCDTPICVINLIDEHRQWFKAEVGLGTRETPLESSICAHVILENDFVEINNTLEDPRTSDNPLCLAPDKGLQFYAGTILKTREGLPIGTLCVLDYKPRELTPLQRDALRLLGRQVMRQLDFRLESDRQDTLHREVDHRVKNSLSSVCAMMRMQEKTADSLETKLALRIAQNRVQMVVALHREMHKAANEKAVNLKRFMKAMGTYLQASAPNSVTVIVDFDSAIFISSSANAFGMIVNEFVSNSIKHGFADGRAGRVAVYGRILPDGRFKVTGEDNGAGSKDGAKAIENSGLGLKIMRASAERLGTTLDYSIREDGARMTLITSPSRR